MICISIVHDIHIYVYVDDGWVGHTDNHWRDRKLFQFDESSYSSNQDKIGWVDTQIIDGGIL